MEAEGVVQNGVVVLDNAAALPEGTRVRVIPAAAEPPRTFGEQFAQFKGAAGDMPEDLAEQHDHYRPGTAKGRAR